MVNSNKKKCLIVVLTLVLVLAIIFTLSSIVNGNEAVKGAAIVPTYSTLGTHNLYSPVNDYFDYTGDKHSSNASSGDELIFRRDGGAIVGSYTGNFTASFRIADNLFTASKNGYLKMSAKATVWSNKTAGTYDDVSSTLKYKNGANIASTGSVERKSATVENLSTSSSLGSNGFELVFTASPAGGLLSYSEADSHFKQPQIILESSDVTAPESIKFSSASVDGDNVNVIIQVVDSESGVMDVVLDGYTATAKSISSDTKDVTYTFTVPQSLIRQNAGKISVKVTDNVGNSKTEDIQAFSSNPSLNLSGTNYGGYYVSGILNGIINNSQNKNNVKYYYTVDGSIPTLASSLLNGTLNVPDGDNVVVNVVGIDEFGYKTDVYKTVIKVDTKDYEIKLTSNFDGNVNLVSSQTKKRNAPFTVKFLPDTGYALDTKISAGYLFDGNNYSMSFGESRCEFGYETKLTLFKDIATVFVPSARTYTFGEHLKIDEGLFSTSNIPNGIDGFDEAYWLRKNTDGTFAKVEGKGIFDLLPSGEYKLFLRYCDNTFETELITIQKREVVFDLNNSGETYDGEAIGVIMTADSGSYGDGLNFTYSVSGKNGVVKEVKNAGTYTFKAEFNNDNYFTYQDTLTFEVKKQKVSFKLNAYSGTYNGEVFSVIPEADCLTPEFLGLSYSIVNQGAIVKEVKNAGTYTFTVNFDKDNFEPTTGTDFDFVVKKSDIVIKGNDFNTIYGKFENPQLSYTLSGRLYDDVNNVISGELYLVDGMDNIVTGRLNAGSYGVKADKLELINSNYALTVENGVYRVEKKDLLISFAGKNYSVEYGAKDVEFDCPTVSGFAYNDEFAFTVDKGFIDREIGNSAGTYDIFIKDFAKTYTNYNAVYENNFYTITKRAVFIEIDEYLGKVYGSGDTQINYNLYFGSVIKGDKLVIEREPGENVGSYKYTVSSNPNYIVEIINSDARYTISKRDIEVAPDKLRGIYGDNLDYRTIGEGLLKGDSLEGQLKLSEDNVGTRKVLLGSLNNPNYNVIIGDYDYEVLPKEITVTANGGSAVYGDDVKNLGGYTNTELVGDDTIEVALTADEFLKLGLYEIRIDYVMINGNKTFINYTINFVTNNFEIIQKTEVSIIIDEGQKSVYGDELNLTYGLSDSLVSGDELTVEFYCENPFAGIQEVGIKSAQVFRNGEDVSLLYGFTVHGNVTIIAREVVISLENGNKYFGDSDDLSYVGSNLISGDSLSGTLTRNSGENVGSYAVNFSGLSVTRGENDITSSYVFVTNEKYIIEKRNIIISAHGSKTYDGTTQVTGDIEYSAENMLQGWQIAGEFGVEFEKNVGKYNIGLGTIQIKGCDTANYDITVEGCYEVTPKEISVTYTGKTDKVYGDEDPEFDEYKLDGLCEGDSENEALSGKLSRKQGDNVGKYDIFIGDAIVGSNYVVTLNPATFEITKRVMSVNVKTKFSKKYGEVNPVVTDADFTVGNIYDGYEIPKGLVIIPDAKAVGKYNLEINSGYLNGNVEYVLSGKTEFEIIKNELVISQIAQTIYYDGLAHEIKLSIDNTSEVGIGDLVIKYPNGGAINAIENEIFVAFGGNENFVEKEYTFILKIEKAPVNVYVYKESFVQGELYLADVLNDEELCKTIYTVSNENVKAKVEFEIGDYPSEPGSYKYKIEVEDDNYVGSYSGVMTILPIPQFNDGFNSVQLNITVSDNVNIKIIEEKNGDILSPYMNSVGKVLSNGDSKIPHNIADNKYIYSRVWVTATDSENRVVTLSGKINVNRYYISDCKSADTRYTVLAMSNKDGRTLEQVNAELMSEEIDGETRYYLNLSSIDATKQYLILAEIQPVQSKFIYYLAGIALLGLISLLLIRSRRFKAARVFNNKFFNKSKMNKLGKKNNFSKRKPLRGLD